ncbi:hypothetical protein B0T25DRAFT_574706 [Lasiosphaeria hispida]|uniref:NmrA-like domain-containing protein n=1 Tax=Lasiosphaeria hispida TaxID=260671 RepID=A0AAJ0H565_9PEZI|nr:hypothetical protein B0T25DRAFT_574706 [Lasiosphaeria hispida]
MASTKRNILVVGATGKQGSALVHHLLVAPSSDSSSQNGLVTAQPQNLHVWALTRSSSSPTAVSLLDDAKKSDAADKISLIEGNLEDPSRIREVFETVAAAEGGLWGVFVAIAFPGLGVEDEREKDQGIMLADLALEFKVEAFIYSSALQPVPGNDDTVEFSRLSKLAVENHCKKLGKEGLSWILLQPGFFMENFDGLIGALGVTVFREGLGKDTTLCLIASEDIGRVAAGVFANHEPYVHRILGLTSGAVTMQEICDSYKRVAGKPIPSIPGFLGRLLLSMNSSTRVILQDVEKHHAARRDGLFPEFEQELELARSVCEMQTFEEWTRRRRAESKAQPAGWNKLSVLSFLTGRS